VSAFVDTNILVRHLTGDPPDMAAQATAYLGSASELLLTDLVVAETIYVLESFYKTRRQQIADAMRSLVALGAVITVDPALLLRAIEVYETDQLDFPEAYFVASAETAGVNRVTSFDRSTDRIKTIERVDPCAADELRHLPVVPRNVVQLAHLELRRNQPIGCRKPHPVSSQDRCISEPVGLPATGLHGLRSPRNVRSSTSGQTAAKCPGQSLG
jgi:predicted nucleic-acid-binding protein